MLIRAGLIRPKRLPMPGLNINFAQNGLDSRITFTRAGSGTYWGSDGNLQVAGTNVPRFTYDPVTLQPKGLMIEEARTNLFLNSTSLSTQNVTTSATPYTVSFYGTGTITFSGTYTGSLVGGGALPTRSTLTFTPTAGTLTCTVTGTVQYAQIEAGSSATSPIITSGTSLSRAADVAQMTGTNFSSWFNQPFGTFVVSAEQTALTGCALARVDSGDNVSRLIAYTANNGLADFISTSASSSDTLATANVVSVNTPFKHAISYTAGASKSVCLKGGTVASNSTFVPNATMTQMIIGNSSGASYLNGTIKSITYYPKRLPDAMLQVLTT